MVLKAAWWRGAGWRAGWADSRCSAQVVVAIRAVDTSRFSRHQPTSFALKPFFFFLIKKKKTKQLKGRRSGKYHIKDKATSLIKIEWPCSCLLRILFGILEMYYTL